MRVCVCVCVCACVRACARRDATHNRLVASVGPMRHPVTPSARGVRGGLDASHRAAVQMCGCPRWHGATVKGEVEEVEEVEEAPSVGRCTELLGWSLCSSLPPSPPSPPQLLLLLASLPPPDRLTVCTEP